MNKKIKCFIVIVLLICLTACDGLTKSHSSTAKDPDSLIDTPKLTEEIIFDSVWEKQEFLARYPTTEPVLYINVYYNADLEAGKEIIISDAEVINEVLSVLFNPDNNFTEIKQGATAEPYKREAYSQSITIVTKQAEYVIYIYDDVTILFDGIWFESSISLNLSAVQQEFHKQFYTGIYS